jgi:hypothetical protein
MITVYAMREWSRGLMRQTIDAFRLVSGIDPAILPESPVSDSEGERDPRSGVSETEPPPTIKRRLSSNQHGRYSRH